MDSASNGPQFISLIELLDRPLSITAGQLATAIENGGVYGWDRFGRFAKANKSNAIQENALDALAELWQKQRTWGGSPENWDAETGLLKGFPFDELCLDWSNELQFFGWLENELPKFQVSTESSPFPSPAGVSTGALYNIIGALLQVASSKRTRPMSEAQLIAQLVDDYKSTYGISKSNLEKQFSLAKRKLDE